MAKIAEIKKKYKDEWVLAEVLAEDMFGQPTEVELIAHSKARDEIYDKQRELNKDIAIIYTGEIPKKGYAVAFDEISFLKRFKLSMDFRNGVLELE